MAKPRIAVFALGGTIAMVKGEAGVRPGLTAEQLVAAAPGIDALARIEARTVSTIGSSDLSVDNVLEVARAIEAAVADGADGAIVTQGTDTMEESAFLLDLALRVDVPVVVTGAMRNPLSISHDGPGNVYAAMQVVTDPAVRREARSLGVMVVMLDTIHAAVDVAKMNSSRIDAFASPEAGPLGVIVEDRVRLTGRPVRDHKTALDAELGDTLLTGIEPPLPTVALLTMGLGESGGLVAAMLADPESFGYAGVVLGAMGGGHTPSWIAPQMDDLVARLPVVMAGRMQAGYVLAKTYERAGSEMDLLRRGVRSAGRLPPLKARMLLTAMLMGGLDQAAMDRVWAAAN
ncbi:asparaginase [Thalassobaculum sp. OXR-137]|uniref:asparaginase n=1 Tax=Thalassobaculum sp. OXR-137 TaxID=3100173 RepID=UPI002AC9579D|nr:asparaginase [Thalassobaculum sp. OXR-137]WPZ34807.1 asparaginase [Thalassobaculum sp. OXR-137]